MAHAKAAKSGKVKKVKRVTWLNGGSYEQVKVFGSEFKVGDGEFRAKVAKEPKVVGLKLLKELDG